ncbi:MAG TPA: glycosyltransferase family 4 protein [Xanthobacteraceae bacterium]|jgi:glycosyltransferase involved in cell wall biosynthesis|nr:glycosyltransferase family 4 protein [Xanthobacteraceae bacterium]
MTGFVIRMLRKRDLEPVIVHYEPYSVAPALSVPAYRLFRGRVGHETRQSLDGCETHAIGAWLPELEVTHYLVTQKWRQLMDSAQAYVVVSGNALGALPYCQARRNYVAWLASGWNADRVDRVKTFSLPRSAFDRAFVRPAARRLERAILKHGTVLSLSQYTRRTLDDIAGAAVVRDILPMPIDIDFFQPVRAQRIRGRIGFSGRLDDPRKNITLLLEAVSRLRRAGHDVSALLIGGEQNAAMAARLMALGISDVVAFRPYGARDAVRTYLQTLDLFVVPSHQEGLCIAALEAMACGIPVVSTRCGGPEEFVIDGQTGCLVDFDASAMAEAIAAILSDREKHEQLCVGARRLIITRYANAYAENVFWTAFDRAFPELLKRAA